MGDEKTDDTAAIQNAIDTHRVLYFPERPLCITDTLDPEAGHGSASALHPTLTQFDCSKTPRLAFRV